MSELLPLSLSLSRSLAARLEHMLIPSASSVDVQRSLHSKVSHYPHQLEADGVSSTLWSHDWIKSFFSCFSISFSFFFFFACVYQSLSSVLFGAGAVRFSASLEEGKRQFCSALGCNETEAGGRLFQFRVSPGHGLRSPVEGGGGV